MLTKLNCPFTHPIHNLQKKIIRTIFFFQKTSSVKAKSDRSNNLNELEVIIEMQIIEKRAFDNTLAKN